MRLKIYFLTYIGTYNIYHSKFKVLLTSWRESFWVVWNGSCFRWRESIQRTVRHPFCSPAGFDIMFFVRLRSRLVKINKENGREWVYFQRNTSMMSMVLWWRRKLSQMWFLHNAYCECYVRCTSLFLKCSVELLIAKWHSLTDAAGYSRCHNQINAPKMWTHPRKLCLKCCWRMGKW